MEITEAIVTEDPWPAVPHPISLAAQLADDSLPLEDQDSPRSSHALPPINSVPGGGSLIDLCYHDFMLLYFVFMYGVVYISN